MDIKIKRLNNKAVIPEYAHQGDCAMDLVATEKIVVDNGDYGFIEYKTGIALDLPEGYIAFLKPRSSVSKTGLIEATSGIIDQGYKGEISYRFKSVPNTKQYEVGDRICQMYILPVPKINFVEVEELSDSSRKDGAYGSTGS